MIVMKNRSHNEIFFLIVNPTLESVGKRRQRCSATKYGLKRIEEDPKNGRLVVGFDIHIWETLKL